MSFASGGSGGPSAPAAPVLPASSPAVPAPTADFDLLELITPKYTTVVSRSQHAAAEEYLKACCADIRLDLHGVLDLVNPDTPILVGDPRATNRICAISYVGRDTPMRRTARDELLARIKSGQIDFAILIFERGSKSEKNDKTFTVPGSKAWVNAHLSCTTKCLFLDDSNDHVQSTKSLAAENIDAQLINDGFTSDKLLLLIRKWVNAKHT